MDVKRRAESKSPGRRALQRGRGSSVWLLPGRRKSFKLSVRTRPDPRGLSSDWANYGSGTLAGKSPLLLLKGWNMRTNVSESHRRQTRSLPAFLMLALALSVPSLLAGAEPDSDPDAAAGTRLEGV